MTAALLLRLCFRNVIQTDLCLAIFFWYPIGASRPSSTSKASLSCLSSASPSASWSCSSDVVYPRMFFCFVRSEWRDEARLRKMETPKSSVVENGTQSAWCTHLPGFPPKLSCNAIESCLRRKVAQDQGLSTSYTPTLHAPAAFLSLSPLSIPNTSNLPSRMTRL